MTERQEPSLKELFTDLIHETGTLIRQEVALAKSEVTETAGRVGKDVAKVVAGGLIAYAGFLVLLATIVIVLADLGLDWWLAALIVAVVVLGAGAVLILGAVGDLKKASPVPQQTIETLKEDRQWLKEQAG